MSGSRQIISSALVSSKANLNHSVTVTGIKVTYKKPRKDYLVSVRIEIDGEVANKSRKYDKDQQEFFWYLNNRFSPEIEFTVVIREHHRIRRRDRYVRTVVSVANMIMKSVFVIDEPDGEAISLCVCCETGGPFVELIHNLVEEAQGRLSNMRTFIEQLGKVCEVLNIITAVSEPLGDAHPAVKAAVKVARLLYEKCNTVQECHAAATELMDDIASFLPFTEIPTERCKSTMTIQTSESLLGAFERISRAIIDSSTDSILGLLLNDRLTEVNGYKEKLRRLKETFDWCVNMEAWKTALLIETHTANLFLNLLRPVHSAFFDNNKACFEGSRRGTIAAIEQWLTSDSKVFWLHGSEGCGKTAIAHTISKLFEERFCLAGCFFFDGGNAERRNLNRVIPTIAYQLAKRYGEYSSDVRDVLRGHHELNIHTSLDDQFNILLKRPLAELSSASLARRRPPTHNSLVVVLDALEQCSNSEYSRRFLAGYVRRIAGLVPWLKVFVSSRKLTEFSVLSGSDCQEIDISDPLVDCESDIAAYAKYRANSEVLPVERALAQAHTIPQMHSRIRVLTQRLGALVIGDGVEAGAVEVEKLGMDELFHLSILAIMSRSEYGEDMLSIIRDVLAVVALVTATGGNPPTRNMLLQLLSPFWPTVTSDALSGVLHSLRPILSFDGSEVELLFPAGLLLRLLPDERRSGAFAVDIDKVGNRVAQRCLDEMDAQLQFVICRLDSSYLLNDDADNLAALIKSRIPKSLYYACLIWMDCVIKSGDAQAFSETVLSFLCSPKALVWLEVLSLTGNREVSREILLKCIDFFKDYNEIFKAAKVLHEVNSIAIEISKPHVYLAALALLSDDLFLSGHIMHFASNRPKITCEISASEESTECVDSEGGFFRVAYSTDGSQIVSGHKDGRLNIRDGRTGVLIHGPLSGHAFPIISVAFSRDGSRIVSGSRDELRIWDTSSGKLVAGPFKTESSVIAVAFSPDGSRFVTADYDCRIRIWDAQKGDALANSLDRHENWVRAIGYSPDGNRMVTGSHDMMLRIWDANTAASICNPLVGHKDPVYAVAYSPDGSKILSGSEDRSVRIWDARTGTQLGEPLKGNTDSVWDIGYSRDGSRIISSSHNGIQMWDANSDAPVGVIRRGESRWDIERQCFVSIPSWWPGDRTPKIQSLLLSANPLYILKDGWTRTLDGGLLLWLPLQHRGCTCHTTQDSTITRDEQDERLLNSEWRKLFHGKD